MSILKTRIKELRWAHKIQQAELARAVGVRRETIANLESGKYNPSLKLAIDIAHYFKKPVEEVFSFEDDDDVDQAGVLSAAEINCL
ncbi:MAG: helix-turn-helix transcriptional regulator [Clostridia bacterium]|nr:helix-turn-helix transcriptional regulator [Clostridia bacterium]